MDDIANQLPLNFHNKKDKNKKTLGEEYNIKRQKFIATQLKKKDEVLNVAFEANEKDDILLITSKGQSIRFALDTVSATGRATSGVIGIQLDKQDEVVWADQITKESQLIISSERGSMKRVLSMDFEPQGRNGKGVKVFTFNKNGSNGSYIAGVAKIDERPWNVVVSQVTSPIALFSSDEILLQGKAERGKPYVMALMEDVVTGIIAIPKSNEDE